MRGALRRTVPWVVALSWISLCGCEGTVAPVVATVNGEAISLVEFERAVKQEAALFERERRLTREETSALAEGVLDRLIQERIMLQHAHDLSLSVEDAEVEGRIEEIRRDYDGQFDKPFGDGGIAFPEWKQALAKRMLLEKLVSRDINEKIHVSNEEAERYYRTHRKSYAMVRRVRVAQIVLPDRRRAEEALKRLKAGEDFAKVAREVSTAPEAVKGGDLGFFTRGVMPEAVDRMLFALPEGKISGVAQSPYGFHIFKVLGKANAGGPTFADVRETVVADLKREKEAEAYVLWIEGLRTKASIRINRPLPKIGNGDEEFVPPQDSKSAEAARPR